MYLSSASALSLSTLIMMWSSKRSSEEVDLPIAPTGEPTSCLLFNSLCLSISKDMPLSSLPDDSMLRSEDVFAESEVFGRLALFEEGLDAELIGIAIFTDFADFAEVAVVGRFSFPIISA